MNELSVAQKFAVWVLPVLFAITLHEVAHGWVACKLGDKTAKRLGRLTLNPIKHIDPLGTILLPGILFFLGGVIFGWAKPVPITYENLRHPKRDMVLVAVAGPMANLLMAFLWAGIAKFALTLIPNFGMPAQAVFLMGQAGIIINLLLMIFNLLPIPPLDGGRVVSSLLPGKLSWQYDRLEPYGFFIIIGLILLGVVQSILLPVLQFGYVAIGSLFGILG